MRRSPPWRQYPRFVRSGGTSERQQAAAVGSTAHTAQHSTAPTPRHGTAVLRLLQRVCLRLTAATRAADGGGREAQLVEATLGNSPSVPVATTPSAGVWRAHCWLCSDYSPLRGGTNLLCKESSLPSFPRNFRYRPISTTSDLVIICPFGEVPGGAVGHNRHNQSLHHSSLLL